MLKTCMPNSSRHNHRLERLVKKFSFRIRKVPFTNDILSVQFRNQHLMTVPKKIYSEPNPYYRDWLGHVMPHYFETEHQLKNWNFIVKRTPYIEKYEKDFPWKPFKKPL